VFPDLEVVFFDLPLGPFDGSRDHLLAEWFVVHLLAAEPVEQAFDLVAAEQARDLVFEAEEEPGVAGVALAPAAAAQLVVDAAGFVAFSAKPSTTSTRPPSPAALVDP
jgi:hypothetical protein